jgi:hypothetical protein
MSLTVFMALCILGLDLLIYVFFHRIYGDKRSAVARQVAAFKGQSPNHSGSFHKRPVTGARSRPIGKTSFLRTFKMVARRQKTILPQSAHAFLELSPFCTTAAAIWRLMQTMVTRRTRTTGLFVAA